MRSLLLTLILVLPTFAAVSDNPDFGKGYTVVDILVGDPVQADAKQPVAQQIRRFYVRDLGQVLIGTRAFLVGKGLRGDKLNMDGSNFDRVWLPVDRVVALGSIEDAQGIVRMVERDTIPLGQPIK